MAFFETKKGIISIFFIVFTAMMGIGAVLGGQLNNIFFESVETKEIKGKAINILLMGIDARDAKANSRSDTMIVASIDPSTKKIAMVSIPRDTRIKNSFGKYDKINSINYTDGPEAACKQVGKLLNARVDYYVVTNFGGFGDIVDALGGVHINVESNMRHADPVNPELAINISKGYQYLNGKQALAFVRYRGGPTADIGRTENQQKFIKALAAEMLQSKTILKLPQLIPQLNKNVHTNLPVKDMIYLANMAKKLDMENIAAQTLPGYFYHDNITGASYWEADKKIASILIESLLKGETFKVVGDAPASAQPAKSNPISAAVEKKKEEQVTTPVKENVDKKDTTTGEPSEPAVADGNTIPADNGTNAPTTPTDPGTDEPKDGVVNPTVPPAPNTTVPEQSGSKEPNPQLPGPNL